MSALLTFGLFAAVAGACAGIFGWHWWIIPTAAVVIVALKSAVRDARSFVAALGLATVTATAAHSEWGWPVWLVASGYLAGLVMVLALGVLIINIRSSGVVQVVRDAVDRLHPGGEYRRQARRQVKLLEPTGIPFPIFGLAAPSPIHRVLWLDLDATCTGPSVVSAVVFDSPQGHGQRPSVVRVESRPHRLRAPASDGDDAETSEDDVEIVDLLLTDLRSRARADPHTTTGLTGALEAGVSWDDLVTLGRLLSARASPDPVGQTPITIAVDGDPEQFTEQSTGGRWRATGVVRGCDVEVSADAVRTEEVALQQIADPLSYLYPGRVSGGNPASPTSTRG